MNWIQNAVWQAMLDLVANVFIISNLRSIAKNLKCLCGQVPHCVNRMDVLWERARVDNSGKLRAQQKDPWALNHYSTAGKLAHSLVFIFLRELRNLNFNVKSKFQRLWTNAIIKILQIYLEQIITCPQVALVLLEILRKWTLGFKILYFTSTTVIWCWLYKIIRLSWQSIFDSELEYYEVCQDIL